MGAIHQLLAGGSYGPSDPYFSSVSVLLHGQGANGGTSFPDSSSHAFGFTGHGSAQTSTAQYKFGNSSILLNGSTDYIDAGTNTALAPGSGNFTAEWWFYMTSNAGAYRNWWATDGHYVTENAIRVSTASNGLGIEVATVYTKILAVEYLYTTGGWHHIAIVRNGSSVKAYLDGTDVGAGAGTGSDSTDFSANGCILGALPTVPGYYFPGYMQDIRLTKGVARYTSNFTPPILPFPNQ